MQRRSSGQLGSKVSMASTDMAQNAPRRNNADLELAAEVFKEAKRQPVTTGAKIPDSDKEEEDETETDTSDDSDYSSSSNYTSDDDD
jgi:hypothetical protein